MVCCSQGEDLDLLGVLLPQEPQGLPAASSGASPALLPAPERALGGDSLQALHVSTLGLASSELSGA